MTNLPATTSAALVPFQELERMAAAVAKSGLFGIKTADQAIALMLIAQAEGRHPAIVARDYDIIQGRPAKKAEAMLRDFMAAGGTVKWHKLDDSIADATFSHPQGGEVRIVWDTAQAQRAGLSSKATWKQYPRQMLRSRCVSEGCRTVCPQSTSGMYDTEEVRDFTHEPEQRRSEPPRDVSPAEGFAGAPARELPIGKPTTDADALLPDRHERAVAAMTDDSWKDRRAVENGFADRREQTAAVSNYLDDQKGFSISAEWTAKQMLALEPPRKTLWGLRKDELALLHEALRKAGDAGERFKKTGPQFANQNGGVPPEPERGGL